MTLNPRVLVATGNPGKLEEMRRLLGDQVQLVGLADVAPYDASPETGATFQDNALVKAREASAASGLPSVADDSGLVVDALNGMPGVLSARWSGVTGSDRDRANLRLVLAQTADVPDGRRAAGFVCAAALALPDGRSMVVQGEVRGRLTRAPRGSGGFGYDPIVEVDGRTLAELAAAEKDAVSHRGHALRALAPLLLSLL